MMRWTQNFVAFVMKGRLQAVLLAGLFAFLGLLFPPFIFLGGGILALITLRKGPLEGVQVAGWSLLMIGILTLGVLGQIQVGLLYGLAQWLPILLFAVLLRRTANWEMVMLVLCIISVLLVLGLHFGFPHLEDYWRKALSGSIGGTLKAMGLSANQASALIERMARYFTGIFVGSIEFTLVVSLILGRFWQAIGFNPGGFGEEFTSWRLPSVIAGGLIVIGLLAYGLHQTWVAELAIVGAIPFLFQGLGFLHGVIRARRMKMGWLVAVYLLLLFVTIQAAAVVAFLGMMDSLFPLRDQLGHPS